MDYKSTRDSSLRVTSAQAIAQGISKDGGLFVPGEIPSITLNDIKALCDMSYIERAECILLKYLTDFTLDEIKECANGAYGGEKFENGMPAPLSKIGDTGFYMLELWHGPTCAFKDMALQLLPYLLTYSAKKTIAGKEIVILVATSGDTGKAALEGFKDVKGTRIVVFYPQDGVSAMQKLQMTTQEGGNVFVCAVKGNFDDCQRGVKEIFTNLEITKELEAHNLVFSSANSINWGRLLPQIIYYISAYCDLVNDKEITLGDEMNIVVPTGNFGNILAAYYAKKMGLPVKKFICASNANNILTDFINTGVYDTNRKFYTTMSPSMDILISSNLERLLYDLSGCDDRYISECMSALKNEGKYTVRSEMLQLLKEQFVGGCCDDAMTQATIKELFEKYSYLCDTHTAVAVKVYNDYVKATGDNTKTVIASTANPYKFPKSVAEAIEGKSGEDNEFVISHRLSQLTKTAMPKPLGGLDEKAVRFNGVCDKTTMQKVVYDYLGI
ncbi:threonine synthase [Acetanaerobacterium elongatum]|uniref:Threonine synthase n=1 Tax=Acetanaerobacterium elongatum TaxID=258515 RepID=A0A1H0BA39_9FIRM|nr:threonine synthase [Acetanaerobacterium elongatum]SDN42564.1 threonine synthase [Acetanaerobacterium elongatum]